MDIENSAPAPNIQRSTNDTVLTGNQRLHQHQHQ